MNRRCVGSVLAGALAACGSGQKKPVRFAMARAGIHYLPIYVARSLGYFQEEAVAVEFYETAGSSKAMEALVGGSADVTVGGHTQILQVAFLGRRVKTFVCEGKTNPLALVLAPGSQRTSIADLKGARLGVTSPGSSSHYDLNFLLSLHDVPPQDVSIVGIGTLAASVTALERRRVEAAMLYSNALSSFLARNPAAPILADLRTPDGFQKVTGAANCAGVVIASTDQWLQQNARAAKAIGRAVKRAMQWVVEHRPEESRERLPTQYHSQDTAADLEAVRYAIADLNADGITTMEMAKATQRMLAVSIPGVASVNVANTFTNDFVNG